VDGVRGPEARIRALGQWRESRITDARERALAEAFVLFYANGIRAVGVDMLVARSGVAKASFYRHFHSKAELVLAYLDRRHGAWLAWLDEEVATRARTKGAQDRLLTVFDALADLFADPDYRGCASINAVAEMGPGSPEVLERALAHKAALRSYLAGLANDAGLRQPEALARQLALLVDGAMVAAQMAHDPAPARSARQAGALLLGSNGKKPATRTRAKRAGAKKVASPR
jgi:AcrR family transcriptional regulator